MMKNFLLITAFTLAAFCTAQAQFLYSNYTVSNINNQFGCSYYVTFVQSGDFCNDGETRVVGPGQSETFATGVRGCNVTSVHFTVKAVGGSVTHGPLLGGSYHGQGGCLSNDHVGWGSTGGNSFNVWQDFIVGGN